MEEKPSFRKHPLIHKLSAASPLRIMLGVLIVAILAGVGSGYVLSAGNSQNSLFPLPLEHPKTAQQDTKTFRDFAEGKITKKPEPKKGQYAGEGTHLLIRDGADPVTLTSSVVDLSQYENKKVKVYGETQTVPGVAWFMDVGKVEEVK